MKEIEVKATVRKSTGKVATREMRKEGLVPCNLYGETRDEKGLPVACALAIASSDLRKVVYTPHIYVIKLMVDGQPHTAIMKEQQFHPTTDQLLHVDFYEVNDQKPITVGIPVRLNGLAAGVRLGGRLNQSIRKIEVTAPYESIPEHLDVDVTELQLGKAIKVGQLSFEGLEIATSPEVIVCSVKATRASKQAANEEGAE